MRSSASVLNVTCAAVMALCAACDTSDTGGGATSESTVCTTVGTSWWNQSFPDQTGTFRVELSAAPSRTNIDAVVGLSAGSATAWTKLAAIVRFNPDGFIDARAGSTYRAVQSLRYTTTTYWIRIDVDVVHHTYSAWASDVQGSFGSWNQVAANFAFRSEQASVTKLNNLSGYVNTTTGGSLQVCGFVLNPAAPGSCVAATAGGGFTNVAVTPGLHGMIVTADATPSAANMDGVVGIASGAVDEYNDFAASVRFYTNGRIEARDGDTYGGTVTYAAGHQYSFKFVIDLENKTYSVWTYDQTAAVAAQLVGENLHFRTQQAGVTQLDHVASIVASSTGRVTMCNARNASPPHLRYARFGKPRVAPSGDNVVEWGSNTGTNETQLLDVNGKFLGSPGFGIGGEPAVDATGNLYLSYLVGSVLHVDAYGRSLTPLWKSQLDVGGGSVLGAAVSGNFVIVAIRQSGKSFIEAFATIDGTGRQAMEMQFTPVIGVGSGGWAIAYPQYNLDGSMYGWAVEAYRPFSCCGSLWYKQFPGSYEVTAVAIGADGSVVFGGDFWGSSINFGDRTLYAIGNSEEGPFNAFFVSLTSTGALRYSLQTGGDSIEDLDTDGNYIAVSNHHFTQMPWVHWGVYDIAGTSVAGCAECDVGLGHQGYGREITLGNHRVYLNVDENLWWPADRQNTPFMFAWDF